ncbi:UDP-N-acetylenolpyruvoylglucosamine reductase [hydrothermal vent metagenome]|uniref:UDP-N-acetylmuramate dehydrogenase n=1 Tax=hydrothermal vent metagenome TaxID=652676 RepID=A0A3B1E3A0_9ZZZZ
MSLQTNFSEITKENEPLAPHTWLKVGGTAQYFVEPRNFDELLAVINCCKAEDIPIRLLGGGSNLLVRDEGVSGAVIKLAPEGFSQISVEGTTVKAGSAALLSSVISETVQAGLAGLETMVGIPGTIGGALHGNAGGADGGIGQFVQSVTVVTSQGEQFIRKEDELSFAYRTSSIDELAIIDVTLELSEKDSDEITSRMRKGWIMKKASQPLSHQSAGCIFKNPRGHSASALIDEAGLKGTTIGNAKISDQHANFFITEEGATANDVQKLIDITRAKVLEQFDVELELEIVIW